MLTAIIMTKVVNKYYEPYDIYIGRGSPYGNPYVIGKDGDRDEVCDKYQKDFNERIQKDPEFVELVNLLEGKRLGCFCKQKTREVRCHGDTFVKYFESRNYKSQSLTFDMFNAACESVDNQLKNGKICPHDTNGDGDCGRFMCPVCGVNN